MTSSTSDFQIGQRVRRVGISRGNVLGTVCYVLPDRIGVAFDERPLKGRLAIFPLQRDEISHAEGDVPEIALRTIEWHRTERGFGVNGA